MKHRIYDDINESHILLLEAKIAALEAHIEILEAHYVDDTMSLYQEINKLKTELNNKHQ